MSVRLYGTEGNGSHARVTEGFRSALEEAGMLEGFVGLMSADGPDSAPLGAQAKAAVFTGPLGAMWRMHFNARHERRYAMVAPNSTEIGVRIERALQETVTHVLAPSEWAAGVLRDKLTLPVEVVPHGVHSAFAPSRAPANHADAAFVQGAFEVLHLSSSDRQRKGTEELIQGWIMAKRSLAPALPPESRLCLVLEQGALSTLSLKYAGRLQEYRITLYPRLGIRGEGLSPAEMSMFYQQFHLVIQPSRGEGFGMAPLEARACGVPVAATLCTGHSQHMTRETPGVVAIAHGAEAPIDDLPGSKAPTVSPTSVCEALLVAYWNWEGLRREAVAHAEQVRADWSWPAQLKEWMRGVRGVRANEC